MESANINPALEKYIATRDRKMKDPISNNPLHEKFVELINTGKVEIGGRSSCGNRVDPTWVFFIAWNEVIKKAKALGYAIAVTPMKHANKSPTMAGGFWQSNIYEMDGGKA